MAARRSTDLHIRLKPRENRAWRASARRSDLTLSAWLRQLGNTAAVPPPPAIPPVVAGDQLSLPRIE